MNSHDGSDNRQLTALGTVGAPDYSPDGTKILFHRYYSDTRTDVVVMDADGTNITPIITSGYNQTSRWSPCGDKIGFSCAASLTSLKEICIANPDGTGITQLTFLGGHEAGYPVWSPDCSRIAFSAVLDGRWDIYVMNADGTNVVQLTSHSASDVVHDWFGNRILFYSERVGGKWHIFRMNESGGGVTQLTDSTSYEAHPRFSPDGTQIVFMSNLAGNEDIYKLTP